PQHRPISNYRCAHHRHHVHPGHELSTRLRLARPCRSDRTDSTSSVDRLRFFWLGQQSRLVSDPWRGSATDCLDEYLFCGQYAFADGCWMGPAVARVVHALALEL